MTISIFSYVWGFGVMRGQQLIEDDLSRLSAKHSNKSTLVARGADTQLDPGCVSARLATNVDSRSPILF